MGEGGQCGQLVRSLVLRLLECVVFRAYGVEGTWMVKSDSVRRLARFARGRGVLDDAQHGVWNHVPRGSRLKLEDRV